MSTRNNPARKPAAADDAVTAGATDAVDAVIGQWAAERPEVDVSPIQIVGRISRLSRHFERELKTHFAGFDLERWEFDVLATLRRSGKPYELSAGALLKMALVTSGAMTNRIDRLEARGLVERRSDAADRRTVLIRLTPQGRKTVDTILVGHMANEERMLATLTGDERQELEGLLRKLLVAFGDLP
ncbi:DNA-binding MarR family transcriptional regulator [Hamadaea flava]|uniref:MarR family winged helix-turn-helix transcriptional regulator n=1 Tax=Hamadaea flava TaxID=1742688 RepID=A0ABV8M2Q7_9ACTN|nr:MarR family transcriptional regulator [Hamadaea flava]MCP2324453.1 DNA-binding MarR family transcriptional regulator [Hamadaea flava]